MARLRRPRRSLPEAELLERFASGESLRSLGRRFGVPHTTVGRRLRRPESESGLARVRERLGAEEEARALERAEERRLERGLSRRASEVAKRDKEHAAWRRRPTQYPNSEYAEWIDQRRRGPRGLSSRERMSTNNELAHEAVAAGGGVEEVIEATGLRTRLNVYRLIDSRTVQKARANDRRRVQRERLAAATFRRLNPDAELIARRAAGESLRSLAADYGVSHSTLSRYFRRLEVAQELRAHQRRLQKRRRPSRISAGSDSERGGDHTLTELAARISTIRCPDHPVWLQASIQDEHGQEPRLVVSYCCPAAEQELRRRLQIDQETRSAPVILSRVPLMEEPEPGSRPELEPTRRD
jgi:lambda repressor-like predicted transcriptional regulator